MEDADALHRQIAHLDGRLTERDQALGDRLERIEAALLGDRDIGLRGMVDRVNALDDQANAAAAVHNEIRNEAKASDRRLHERVDRLEGKWRLAIGIAIGVSTASAGGAAWLTSIATSVPSP